MMSGMKNSAWELLKNAVVLIILLAVTLVVLEMPGKYYEKNDEQLFNQIKMKDYSISSIDEKMNFKQAAESLLSDDSIVIVGEKPQFTNTELLELGHKLVDEMENFLIFPWNEYLKMMMESGEMYRDGMEVQIIRVIDNKIYSFRLGVILYVGEYGDGYIVFDMESNKVLGMVCSSYNDYIGPVDDRYFEVQLENIVNYYNVEGLEADKMDIYIESNYINIVPRMDKESETITEIDRIFRENMDLSWISWKEIY